MVPAILKINFRVRKKNSIPDKVTVLKRTSSKSRLASVLNELDGTARRILIGFFDSSWIRAANSETANVRKIKKIKENQKYNKR